MIFLLLYKDNVPTLNKKVRFIMCGSNNIQIEDQTYFPRKYSELRYPKITMGYFIAN